MAILETLAIQLASNAILFFFLALIGTALWGDASLIFFVAFSVNYQISLWLVFFAAYIGTMIGDSLWFALGKYLEPKIEKNEKLKKSYVKIAEIIELVFGKRHLLALTIVKYLYGTRVITIIYLAKQKIGYKKFLFYDFISTFGWVIGMGFIGWLVGVGFIVLRTAKNIQLGIAAVIIFFILLNLAQKKLNGKLEQIRLEKLRERNRKKSKKQWGTPA